MFLFSLYKFTLRGKKNSPMGHCLYPSVHETFSPSAFERLTFVICQAINLKIQKALLVHSCFKGRTKQLKMLIK